MEDFKCSICGRCCLNIDKVINQLSEIATIIGSENAHFPYSHKNGRCENLSNNNRCTIYDDRPIICNTDKLVKIISEKTGADFYLVRKLIIEQTVETCQLLRSKNLTK